MKFIHLANVNLGVVPDKGSSWSLRRKDEICETFRRLITLIQEHPVDLLYIAGNLFYRPPLKREMEEVNQLFETIPDTRICIQIEDHSRRTAAYRHFSWADNVDLLTRKEAEARDSEAYRFLFQGLQIHPEKKDLTRSLEPISVRESGIHGYLEGDTEGSRIRTRFVPFSAKSYHVLSVNLNTDSDHKALEKAIAEEIRKKGKDQIYQIHIQGVHAPSFLLMPEKIKMLGNILEIRDDSVPFYDLGQVQKAYMGTLTGDYLGTFATGETLSAQETKALYYGLQALLETSRHQ